MNKAFYIVGIVFAFIFSCVTSYYIAEVESARTLELYNTISSYSSYGDPYASSFYSGYDGMAEDATSEAAIFSVFFFLLFITVNLIGLVKTKTKTNKIFAIIGLSLTGIMFLWNFLVLADPGAVSFDEVGPLYTFYALIILAFSIVGLVQSVRYGKSLTASKSMDTDILDS